MRVSSAVSATLDNRNNNIQVLAADTTSGFTVVDGINALTIGTVTAPVLALMASTGIGPGAAGLQTQVGVLNALTGTGRIIIKKRRCRAGQWRRRR